MPDPELQSIEIARGATPGASLIWLHGLGADGHDFEPLVRAPEFAGLPAMRFIFPHAPQRPITVNGGMVMRGWYDIAGLDFFSRGEDEAGIRASARAVERLVQRECARGIAPARIVLAGFSQGGAIALHVGLRRTAALAGVIALSTYLPLASTFDEEVVTARRLPVFLGHGQHDDLVPIAAGIAARERLQQAGFSPDWHEYPVGHGVTEQEIADIARWLGRLLGPPAAAG